MNQQYSSAIVQILTGFNVIRRSANKPTAKVRFLDLPEESDKIIDKFKRYETMIDTLGMEEPDGTIAIDLDFLSEEMGLTKPTIVKTLKNFHDLGFIKYIPPLSAPPIEIIGDLKNVDFEHLTSKRLEKENKLREVVEFIDIPDDKKSEYLDNYFEAAYA